MNYQIKNIHNETIRLFVKKDGIERQKDIIPGHSIVVDGYETKTMKVFKKRGFITICEAQLFESDSFHILDKKGDAVDTYDEVKTIDETVNPNSDEVMDQFHTTEDHEAILLDEDMKYFKENFIKSIKKIEDPTRLEIIEDEVEQYVEGGYIKGEWTEDDVTFLKKHYPTKGRKYCSTHLNRNETSVQKKINAMGLKKKKKK